MLPYWTVKLGLTMVGKQTKGTLSGRCVIATIPDRQIGPDYGWKASKRNFKWEMRHCYPIGPSNCTWLRLESKQKPLKCSEEKVVFSTNLELMFKTYSHRSWYSADSDTAETGVYPIPTLPLKKEQCQVAAGCLKGNGNDSPFIINWQSVNQGFNVSHWCEVRWRGRPSHWPVPSNPAIIVSGGEILILERASSPLPLRHMQPSHTFQYLL